MSFIDNIRDLFKKKEENIELSVLEELKGEIDLNKELNKEQGVNLEVNTNQRGYNTNLTNEYDNVINTLDTNKISNNLDINNNLNNLNSLSNSLQWNNQLNNQYNQLQNPTTSGGLSFSNNDNLVTFVKEGNNTVQNTPKLSRNDEIEYLKLKLEVIESKLEKIENKIEMIYSLLYYKYK